MPRFFKPFFRFWQPGQLCWFVWSGPRRIQISLCAAWKSDQEWFCAISNVQIWCQQFSRKFWTCKHISHQAVHLLKWLVIWRRVCRLLSCEAQCEAAHHHLSCNFFEFPWQVSLTFIYIMMSILVVIHTLEIISLTKLALLKGASQNLRLLPFFAVLRVCSFIILLQVCSFIIFLHRSGSRGHAASTCIEVADFPGSRRCRQSVSLVSFCDSYYQLHFLVSVSF